MKVFYVSCKALEPVFHEILRKKNSTMYPCLNIFQESFKNSLGGI